MEAENKTNKKLKEIKKKRKKDTDLEIVDNTIDEKTTILELERDGIKRKKCEKGDEIDKKEKQHGKSLENSRIKSNGLVDLTSDNEEKEEDTIESSSYSICSCPVSQVTSKKTKKTFKKKTKYDNIFDAVVSKKRNNKILNPNSKKVVGKDNSEDENVGCDLIVFSDDESKKSAKNNKVDILCLIFFYQNPMFFSVFLETNIGWSLKNFFILLSDLT